MSNNMLKVKFSELHSIVVDNVNMTRIIDFLFQEAVLDSQVALALQRQNDPQRQCRDMLVMLHASENPRAFVKLDRAVRREPHLQWLIDCIDHFRDLILQSPSEVTGKCEASIDRRHFPCHRSSRPTFQGHTNIRRWMCQRLYEIDIHWAIKDE